MNRSLFLMQAVAVMMAVTVSSCSGEKDLYLRSLDLQVDTLYATSYFNVEECSMFQASDLVILDDEWLLLSSIQGKHKLLFLNISTKEHFFAIRKGRGPGEAIQGGDLHKYQDVVHYYDYDDGVYMNINVAESICNKQIAIDTAVVFDHTPSKPVRLISCKGGIVSCNIEDPARWYCLCDGNGLVQSYVSTLTFLEESLSKDFRLSVILSSKYCSDPDGTRICAANVAFPALSFARIDSGKLIEYKRYEIAPESGNLQKNGFTSDDINAFSDVHSSKDGFYVLYSGHKIKGDILPSNECHHLIKYDFNGIPVKHYYLDKNVCSLQVEGEVITAVSTYPESCVYKFNLK